MKRVLTIILALTLAVTVSGCTKNNDPPVVPEQVNKEFEELLNNWFVEDISGDYLNLHFTVKNPEKFGITVPSPDFGELDDSDEAEEEDYDEIRDRLDQLAKFDTTTFSTDQLITYKCLVFDYESLLKCSLSDFFMENPKCPRLFKCSFHKYPGILLP